MSDKPLDKGVGTSSEGEAQKSFMKDFEQAINSYAQAVEAGKPQEAVGAAIQALALAAEEAQSHPTPSLVLKQEAVKSRVLEQRGAIEKALAAIAQSIDPRRQNDSPYAVVALARALEKSAELLHRAGDLAQAERAASEARCLRDDLRLPSRS